MKEAALKMENIFKILQNALKKKMFVFMWGVEPAMTSTMFSSPGAVWAVNNIVLAEQWLGAWNRTFSLFRGMDPSSCDKQAKKFSEHVE